MSDTQSPGRGSEQTTFPALDSLRAVGAIAVLTTHVAFWSGAYTQLGLAGRLLARLDVGVSLFFVLSGFLLSRPWLVRATLGRSAPGLGRYYWKRLLRIAPVYVISAVLALTFIEGNRDLDLGDWLTTLFLSDIYVNQTLPDGLTQMWSLATEVAFYLVLPVLMLAAIGRTLRPVRVGAVLLLMCTIAVAWHLSLAYQIPGASQRAVNEWLPAFLIWFALGIGLALLQVLHDLDQLGSRTARVIAAAASTPGAMWLVVGGLMLVASSPVAGPTLLFAATDVQGLTKNLLYAAVGVVVVFTGVFTTPSSGWAKVMGHPAMRHLGHISYGIFCIHLPVLHLVMRVTGYELFDGHMLQILLLTLIVSIVAADVLYRCVERPFMRLKNLGRPSEATTAQSAPSATRTR